MLIRGLNRAELLVQNSNETEVFDFFVSKTPEMQNDVKYLIFGISFL